MNIQKNLPPFSKLDHPLNPPYGQILHGVTRRSILDIAKLLNLKSYEATILLSDLTNNLASEVFASGTAASIAPISEIGIQKQISEPIDSYKFEDTRVGDKLRKYLNFRL